MHLGLKSEPSALQGSDSDARLLSEAGVVRWPHASKALFSTCSVVPGKSS